MRPGLCFAGVTHLQDFVKHGGVVVTPEDTSNFATSLGLTQGLSVASRRSMKIVGSVLRTQIVDRASPIAYGYGDKLSVYCSSGLILNLSNFVGGRGGGRRLGSEARERPTGCERRTIRILRWAARQLNLRKNRRPRPGSRCPSPRNSAATASP